MNSIFKQKIAQSTKMKSNAKVTAMGKCVLVLLFLIFCLTVTTFVFNELEEKDYSSSTVLRILMNISNSTDKEQNSHSTKFMLINVGKPSDEKDRVVRQANQTSNGYYEEQQPVVVHAESAPPVAGNNQFTDEGEKYYLEPKEQQQDPYFAYDGDEYYNPAESYNDMPASDDDDETYEEGRSAQNQMSASQPQYWREYNPWSYVTGNSAEYSGRLKSTGMKSEYIPPSHPSYDNEMADYNYPFGVVRYQSKNAESPEVRQGVDTLMQQQQQQTNYQQNSKRQQQQQQQQQMQLRQKQQQQLEKQSEQSTTSMDSTSPSTENSLLSVVRGLKMMWDLYQAFSSAWNAMAEHRQKQAQELREKFKQKQQKQKQQQQQQQQQQRIRINSKRPTKFNSANSTAATVEADKVDDNKNKSEASTIGNNNSNWTPTNNNNNNKNNSTKLRTTKSPKTKAAAKPQITTTTPVAKVEPRKRIGKEEQQTLIADESELRQRRGTDGSNDPTEVSEGRYIKGDPLKGYYDFVITEGSYKFWAVFQVGTAILIIYSVFAAIYYSKVNPLVSDYDYTDYLGGARSLSGGDLDFIDDDEDQKKDSSSSWYSGILPRTSHSLKFILEAIDKIPADHEDLDSFLSPEKNENGSTERTVMGDKLESDSTTMEP